MARPWPRWRSDAFRPTPSRPQCLLVLLRGDHFRGGRPRSLVAGWSCFHRILRDRYCSCSLRLLNRLCVLRQLGGEIGPRIARPDSLPPYDYDEADIWKSTKVRQLVTVPVPKAALALFNRLAKDKLPHALINHEEFVRCSPI